MNNLLKRKDAIFHDECSTLQEDDAVLLAFVDSSADSRVGVSCIPNIELLLENVGEELSHALFVASILEVHVGHEAVGLCVSVWPLEQHS